MSEQELIQKENVQQDKNKRSHRKIWDTLPIIYIVTFLMILGGEIIGAFIQLLPIMRSNDAWITASLYLSFIGIWVFAVFCLIVSKKKRSILQELGTRPKGNNGLLFLLGLLIGAGLNGICILIAWLNQDIVLYSDTFHPISFLLIFVAVFIQSAAEEFMSRGYMYQRLRRSYANPWVAIIGNSIFFGLLHLFNDGVTVLSILNICLTGLLFSFMVYYFDSLWCAMAAHTAWNFTQNIIFGLPNSGMVVPYSVWKLDVSTARNSFAYNVGFGIEGTLVADVVLLIACVALYFYGKKNQENAES